MLSPRNRSKRSFMPIKVPTISGSLAGSIASTSAAVPITDMSQLVRTSRPSTMKSSTVLTENLLRANEAQITPLRNRFAFGRRDKFYFLTIPGLLRLVECFFALLHVTMFGFYGTFYEREITFVVTPFYISTTREQLYLLVNYFSFMGSIVMVISGIFSSTSNTALLSSLYPFIFDLVQFIMMAAASVSNVVQYKDVEVQKKMVIGLKAKEAASYTGLVLATMHLVSCVYDMVVFIRRWEGAKAPVIDINI
ncbi:uncharacterized protein [Parasteatoda tepidariorum]|uniref:uncharacterized protein isoform X2 n=1 Tax=Parasteatoda tepidariorum TaxID=114398 RepID=UPI0039BC8A87